MRAHAEPLELLYAFLDAGDLVAFVRKVLDRLVVDDAARKTGYVGDITRQKHENISISRMIAAMNEILDGA